MLAAGLIPQGVAGDASQVVAGARGGSVLPPRFRWTAGQNLMYKLRQRTVVEETYLDEQRRQQQRHTFNDLQLTRQWTVQAVDANGIATLQMQIVQVRSEWRRDNDEPVIRDSNQTEHAREMASFLNRPIVNLRLDALGRLVEVKEAVGSSAQRLEAELPFRLVLPEGKWEAGQSWQRAVKVKVEPPLGVGDSYWLEQKYTLGRQEGTIATIEVTTRWREAPPLAEQPAVLPFLWQGEIYFDLELGQYAGARLRIEQDLRDHAGPGSRYSYRSTLQEERLRPDR
ncbi:MAG: hypothetical protein RMJ88_13035 [Thermogemmata sp.]|nr:hypothetical protein [Thermogemmata sp.]